MTSTLLLIALTLVVGCASDIKRQPTELFSMAPEQVRRYLLSQEVSIKLDSGYSRTIGASTQYANVGRIGRGLVLQPTDSVLTLEGAHVHEAYIVVANGLLIGFYLPFEKAFSNLSPPVRFPLVERN